MRVTWLFAVLLGAYAAACSPAPTAPVQDPAAVREEVLAVSRAFDDSQRTKNREEMDRYLAPDFRIIYSSGRVSDREGFMDGFSSPTMVITDLHVEEPFYVDLGENAAVVGGIGVIRGTESGAPFEERFRYADTFVRRDGRWYAVYVQVSPLSAPSAQN